MDELSDYIKQNLSRGVKPEAIKHSLRQAGYTDTEVGMAFEHRPQRHFPYALKSRGPRQWLGPIIQRIKKPFSATTLMARIPPKIRKILPYLALAALMTALLPLMLLSKQKPPIVTFIDNTTGDYASGSVYYDGTYLGNTKGTFNKLPEDFCKKNGVLQIVTNRGPFAFFTDKSDCKTKRLSLVVNIIEVKEVMFYITMEFMTEEREQLSGNLYIDSQDKGTISGAYEIYKEECKLVRVINLTDIINAGIPDGYVEWVNEPELCENDIIRYKAKTYYKEEIALPEPIDLQSTLLAIQKATKDCRVYCPNVSVCSTDQKLMFCTRYLNNLDLDGNGKFNDYITPVLDNYGVCESNLYCSQLINCNCETTLTFDTCTELICIEYQKQNLTAQRATEMLRSQFSEGDCTNDNEYDKANSWWTNYINEGRLSCKQD